MYYKFILSFILVAVSVLSAYSQQEAFERNTANTLTVFDANGKVFVNPNTDIAGSPYFIEGWKYGIVTLNNNAVYAKRLVRLNFQSQEVHYLSENNIEMVLPAGYVKEVTLIDSAKIPVTGYTFQCGFFAIDNQGEKYLYLIISNGKLKMLESIRKKIIIEKNDFSGEANKEYRTYEDYYFFSGSSMQRLKKDKAFVLNIMIDQKDKIEEYAKKNNLGYKSLDDLQKITDYYNSLPLH